MQLTGVRFCVPLSDGGGQPSTVCMAPGIAAVVLKVQAGRIGKAGAKVLLRLKEAQKSPLGLTIIIGFTG